VRYQWWERCGGLTLALAFLLILPGCSVQARQSAAVVTVDHGPNSANQTAKPYVILISLDGFRYDYAKRYGARNLLAFSSRGAAAPAGMIPPYPSITFPSHYTIVTGLYPEHHGIVANVFYDPARKQVYSYHDASTVTDGTWYGGTPLWVLAEEQGMRAACFFWPGSEADIQGVRPTYYAKYSDQFPNDLRVEQVLAWLRLPAARRPHFITLYFSDTDHAGHEYGPDSPQTADAVLEVDKELGKLSAGIKALRLPVDEIVVSDHGMASVQGDWVNLDELGLDVSLLEKHEGQFLYAKSDGDAQKIFEALREKSDKFKVYRRAQLPEHLHFNSTPRAGDPVIVETGPYEIRISGDPAKPKPGAGAGAHGFDPALLPEMKGIFFASGPDIRPGVTVAPFENVNIYPLIAKILGLDADGLKTGPLDGKLSVLQSILKKPN
jgi:predicted AlkP superfamily pyrophosphatase or phosphodiesterase